MKWYHWINESLSGIGIILGLDVANTSEILGLILVILNILVLFVSLILKLVAWYKKAKEDGKITKEEIEEAIDIVNQSKEDLDKFKKEE